LINEAANDSKKALKDKMEWEITWKSKRNYLKPAGSITSRDFDSMSEQSPISKLTTVKPARIPKECCETKQKSIGDNQSQSLSTFQSEELNRSALNEKSGLRTNICISTLSHQTITLKTELKALSILILDDDMMISDIYIEYCNILSEELNLLIEVETVDNIKEARALIDINSYHLAIVDCNVLDGRGDDFVVRYTQAEPMLPHPLYALASGEDIAVISNRFTTQVNPFFSFLSKPVNLQKFKLLLLNCITYFNNYSGK